MAGADVRTLPFESKWLATSKREEREEVGSKDREEGEDSLSPVSPAHAQREINRDPPTAQHLLNLTNSTPTILMDLSEHC